MNTVQIAQPGNINQKVEYRLPKPIYGYALSTADLSRYATAFNIPGLAAPIRVTVYPYAKRRKAVQASPKAQQSPINGARPNQGALVAPLRVNQGDGMRAVNWNAFGTGAATRSGLDQRLHSVGAWDSLSTRSIDDDEDTTYRWDHRTLAYAHADQAPGLAMCKRTSAYGATVDHARDTIEVRGGIKRVEVERRPVRRQRGVVLNDTGMSR